MPQDNRPKNNNVVRRSSYDEFYDDFPTPPWATRAFFEYVASALVGEPLTVLEPACGRGHMVRVLKGELGFKVVASDKLRWTTCVGCVCASIPITWRRCHRPSTSVASLSSCKGS